jgi:SAM-dependent methyltransferase
VSVATREHSATRQGDLWSARALDWATYQEVQFHPVYTEVLGRVPKIVGQRVLDVGCGSGLFIQRAAKHGATVTGLDAARGLVAIARRRLPDSELRLGEMETLPYFPGTFDIVTVLNAVDLAGEPVAAMEEAHRVLRPGGLVVALTTAGPEQNRPLAAYLAAVSALVSSDGAPDPFTLSAPGTLSRLVRAAGFADPIEYDVPTTWEYADETHLLRGLLSSGPMVRAVAQAGSYAVTSAVLSAVEPYRTPSGGYRLENVFRYVVATARRD